jgi:hypothetical protein
MRTSGVLALALGLAGALLQSTAAGQVRGSSADPAQSVNANEIECHVTTPNERRGPGATYRDQSMNWHGTDAIATQLWPHGTIVFRPGGPGFVLPDGSLSMKFLWVKIRRPMIIEGRRLDTQAPPLRVNVDHQFDAEDFQPSSLIFPTPGCWEVTSRVGESSLTFVTRVVKIAEGPARVQ